MLAYIKLKNKTAKKLSFEFGIKITLNLLLLLPINFVILGNLHCFGVPKYLKM